MILGETSFTSGRLSLLTSARIRCWGLQEVGHASVAAGRGALRMPSSVARPLMNLCSIRVFAPLRAGSQEASHATVANRTAKCSICRISALLAEIKALSRRGELRLPFLGKRFQSG